MSVLIEKDTVTESIKSRSSTDNKNAVKNSIEKLIAWKDNNGYYSYDQYDFWSTKYGIWSKSVYYKSRMIGAALVAPIFIAEIFCPAVRKAFVSKKRFPIADAHFMMAHVNMYHYSGDKKHLQEAEQVAAEMMKSSVPGHAGHCWGYPFNWMTTRGLWTSGIPLMTTTVYCFEAFLALYDASGDEKYLEVAHSIFQWTMKDIKDVKLDEETNVCSYSPVDNSQIVNANAYRSCVLIEGYKRFNNSEALDKAKRNINFILKAQREDGSWLYAVNDERDAFVDNFHTCFVLKNLVKVNRVLKDDRIASAIKKGYNFYKEHLLDEKGEPKPFAALGRFNVVKREMYDYAEGISLAINMQPFDKNAAQITEKLVSDVTKVYQKKDGSFITRISLFNIPNKVPYLRWSQSQLFYALTNYLLK